MHNGATGSVVLPLPAWGEGRGEGVTNREVFTRPKPLTPPLSHPNSGLPEFGTLSWPKSDISDFGWEREQTELAATLTPPRAPHRVRAAASPPACAWPTNPTPWSTSNGYAPRRRWRLASASPSQSG